MIDKKLDRHRYELPCANCLNLVSLTPKMWLNYSRNKKLPFCVSNGCKKYKKYLSADSSVKEKEDDYYRNSDQ